DRVGDLRTAPSDPLGQLLLRHVELFEELLISRPLFEWIQLHSVNVLQQRLTQKLIVRSAPNDRRDALPTERHSSTKPPLPHDEFIFDSAVAFAERIIP